MEGGRKEDSTTSGAMAAGFMNFPENDTTDYTLNELKLTPRHPNQASVRTLTEIEQFLIDNAAPDPPENSSSPADSIPPPHVHTHSYIHATELELKHLQRRIDLRIVPICATLYLLCFLCRQNIGNAKTYHMKETLPVNSTEYQLALTVFFLTYSTFDIPCNILMRKLGPRVWLPSIALISGVVTACMGLVKNSGELIGVRAVLGMAECGLFPGVAMVITMWYVKKEAQLRQALFFCAASMAGAFAGLLAVGLSKMDGVGDYEGWRWILIVEGLLTVVVAASAYFIVENGPSTATFLTERDRQIIAHRLRNDEFGLVDDSQDSLTENERDQEDEDYIRNKLEEDKRKVNHNRSTIFKMVFGDWHIYAHIIVFYGISAPLYSISLCLPSILKELSPTTTSTTANLLTIPIYITACLLSLVTAYLSDRTGRRAPFLFAAYAVMFIGFLIALVRPLSIPALAYVGVFIAACGIYPAFPGMITWCANNFGGTDKVRSVGMAFHIGMGSFGGAMGANFYTERTASGGFRLGHALNLGFVTMGGISVMALWISYRYVNNRREKLRRQRREKLEESVGAEKAAWKSKGEGSWEDREREMRRDWEVAREIELVELGSHSIWFVYTI